MATPKCHHVKPKCPRLKPKCPLFLGQFVLLPFVFNKLVASVVIFFLPPILPAFGRSINYRFSTADCRLPHFEFPISSFQFPVSDFQFPVSKNGAGVMRAFAEAMGKGTWRGRCRARSGRRGASRAYPAAPFQAEGPSPSGVASNFCAVILWITYQEIKGGVHCDLIVSCVNLLAANASANPRRRAKRRQKH
jgi:hypothetical protein